jgi:hypothetical protein
VARTRRRGLPSENPGATRSEPSLLYSSKCVEGAFSEVVFGILGELERMGQLARISQSQFANRGVGVSLDE